MREIAAKHIIYNLEIKNNNQLKKKQKQMWLPLGRKKSVVWERITIFEPEHYITI